MGDRRPNLLWRLHQLRDHWDKYGTATTGANKVWFSLAISRPNGHNVKNQALYTQEDYLADKPEKKFYPDYLFEILVVTLVSVEIVIALSYLYAPVTGRPIDFSRNFLPLPEWYFLFLYQLLKYFPGKWAFLGVMVIPLAGIYLLYALPFMEKTRSRRLSDRKVSAVVGGAMLLGAAILTVLSVAG